MSRIGKKIIPLPKGTKVSFQPGTVTVEGANGKLTTAIHPDLKVEVEDGVVKVLRPNDDRQIRAQHGLARTLVSNAITGCSTGFTETLQIIGVGYRCTQQGDAIQFQLGHSHPIDVQPPPGIKFVVEADNRAKTNHLHIKGADKQLVGQLAANLRALRPPEPYKGKGVRYVNEVIIKKMGKAGKAGK
jgi:large subunit ribosomal protein L6